MDRQRNLPGIPPGDDREALRRAFRRVPGLGRRFDFEQALEIEALRRCLAIMARNKRRRGRR